MIQPHRSTPNEFSSSRILLFYIVIAGVLTFYFFHLFNIQILKGAEYRQKALNNSTSSVTVPATRGIITDRNGYVLARNIASYDVTITPALLPEDEGSIEKIIQGTQRCNWFTCK